MEYSLADLIKRRGARKKEQGDLPLVPAFPRAAAFPFAPKGRAFLIQARAPRRDGCSSAPFRGKRCSPITLRALRTSSHDRPLFPNSVWIIMSFIEMIP